MSTKTKQAALFVAYWTETDSFNGATRRVSMDFNNMAAMQTFIINNAAKEVRWEHVADCPWHHSHGSVSTTTNARSKRGNMLSGLQTELTTLKRHNEELVKALEAVQWFRNFYCPSCDNGIEEGHAPSCVIDQALRNVRGS